MTKKELYILSIKISGEVLRKYFETSSGFGDMETNSVRKKARKSVYDTLAPLLLEKDKNEKQV